MRDIGLYFQVTSYKRCWVHSKRRRRRGRNWV